MNLEELYRVLRNGHVQAQGIFDTVPDPLLILDENLCVQSANRAFFAAFNVGRDETIGQHLYELGDQQWGIPELRRLLEEVIPKSTAVVDYEVEQEFPGLGRRTMLVSAHGCSIPTIIAAPCCSQSSMPRSAANAKRKTRSYWANSGTA